MAANPNSLVCSELETEKRYHVYHAEAHVLSGNLKHPVDQPLETYARVALNNRRADHITQTVEGTSVEGLVSFKSGHTSVSGSQLKNKKDLWGRDHSGWVTLSTSVIEGLNVFEVITADRVVAQISTEHSDVQGQKPGHVPKVTFLGTRFENLRIAGYPVDVELNLGICGDTPKDDQPYLADLAFLDRVQLQLDEITGAKDLPQDMEKKYKAEVAYINDLKNRADGQTKQNGYSKLQCSLIKSIGPIPIPGVRIFGNVIFIPDFGTVSLAEVEVGTEASHDTFFEKSQNISANETPDSNYFTLNMMNMHLGCIGGGTVVVAQSKSNGTTRP
jgi:hypothetical protein